MHVSSISQISEANMVRPIKIFSARVFVSLNAVLWLQHKSEYKVERVWIILDI